MEDVVPGIVNPGGSPVPHALWYGGHQKRIKETAVIEIFNGFYCCEILGDDINFSALTLYIFRFLNLRNTY